MNGWFFDIARGVVYDYDPIAEQFLPLGGGDDDAHPEPPASRRRL
jgi:hypothetical protein